MAKARAALNKSSKTDNRKKAVNYFDESQMAWAMEGMGFF